MKTTILPYTWRTTFLGQNLSLISLHFLYLYELKVLDAWHILRLFKLRYRRFHSTKWSEFSLPPLKTRATEDPKIRGWIGVKTNWIDYSLICKNAPFQNNHSPYMLPCIQHEHLKDCSPWIEVRISNHLAQVFWIP